MTERILSFTVNGQQIAGNHAQDIVADSRNYLRAKFIFHDWGSEPKTAVFIDWDEVAYNVLLDDANSCLIPHEIIKAPGFYVSAFGGDLMTSNKAEVTVEPSGCIEGIAPPQPTPDIYSQLVQQVKSEKEIAQSAAITAGQAAGQTASHRAEITAKSLETGINAQAVAMARQEVASNKQITITQRELAQIAALAAQQALSDLLAMMGTDVATLTGGKLTPSQIPAIAITETFVRGSEAEMLALVAQAGDICIRTDQSKTYVLQGENPAVLSDWQRLQSPTNYADEAGHSATTDNAANADRINNKRVVGMTQSQYDNAALDPDTFYLVTPDEV